MFNFIKKAGTGVALDKEDRERRKKDKKERKEKQKRDRTSMSAEELLRLDEVIMQCRYFDICMNRKFADGNAIQDYLRCI